jgi:type II secretory pathway component PulF
MEENKENKEKKGFLSMELDIGGMSDTDILLFTKHLGITIKSGLTVIEGLEILGEQSKGKMAKVLKSLIKTVRSGGTLEMGLKQFPQYFSAIFTNMVKTGEASGTLEGSLKVLSEHLNKSSKLKKKIKSAMIYPIMVFVAVFGLGMSVAIFVLPKILPLFKSLDVELPATTRGLIFIAEIFEKYGLYIVIGIIGFTIAFFWLIRRDSIKPFTHRLILKIPVLKNIIEDINLERFTRTFGTLLDRAYKKAIKSLIPDIESGTNLSNAIGKHPDLFPMITYRMIGVGESTGNLDNTLKYLAEYYEESVDEATKNLATIIEPVMLIVIGIIVGTVAIAILGPIYQITGSLRG